MLVIDKISFKLTIRRVVGIQLAPLAYIGQVVLGPASPV